MINRKDPFIDQLIQKQIGSFSYRKPKKELTQKYPALITQFILFNFSYKLREIKMNCMYAAKLFLK
ncbi:hypothetical protein SD10_20335 [Spirosoma radiotolerans]|uniref:Uncharacterized protein n=1 Tax=Spirosoma radiotolerans TaxID=1379870 RepID=A0A0E3ZYN6_9BACT|nr:hypothetical protein SD10_20335 [Spirosoma radiotolerans]